MKILMIGSGAAKTISCCSPDKLVILASIIRRMNQFTPTHPSPLCQKNGDSTLQTN
jgi:hypothetical protein